MMEVVKEVISETPVFPYLWVPHCILMCSALRTTLGPKKWLKFSRTHPLSCFLLGMLYIYPGGILASIVRGESILSFLKLTPNLYAACVSWYLSFYCPWDMFFKSLSALRIFPILSMLQDWQRVGLVKSGLETINEESPGYFVYPVVFGVIKSSGFMLIKYVEVGILNGLRTGFRVPNQATKTMIVAAIILQLQNLYSVFPVTTSEVYCILVVFAMLLRLVTTLLAKADWDPYLSLENLMCTLVYGRACEETPTEEPKKKLEKDKKKN